jgi:hypothetical protein
MKCYVITRAKDGKLILLAQSLIKGKLIEQLPVGTYDIGNASQETFNLALAVMTHYYGASALDAPALAEAVRKTKPFMEAFLLTHHMLPGATYEIPGEVLDKFFSL